MKKFLIDTLCFVVGALFLVYAICGMPVILLMAATGQLKISVKEDK